MIDIKLNLDERAIHEIILRVQTINCKCLEPFNCVQTINTKYLKPLKCAQIMNIILYLKLFNCAKSLLFFV